MFLMKLHSIIILLFKDDLAAVSYTPDPDELAAGPEVFKFTDMIIMPCQDWIDLPADSTKSLDTFIVYYVDKTYDAMATVNKWLKQNKGQFFLTWLWLAILPAVSPSPRATKKSEGRMIWWAISTDMSRRNTLIARASVTLKQGRSMLQTPKV